MTYITDDPISWPSNPEVCFKKNAVYCKYSDTYLSFKIWMNPFDF